MPRRLPSGGRLIDRDRPVAFRWNGRRLSGFAGDTLASALLGAGQGLMGRSFKYHRPRGPVAAGAEEPNALVSAGRGARRTPNLRATTLALAPGLSAESQNHWPSLEVDVGEAAAALSPLLPAGFYYKTFIHPRRASKWPFEPAIRAAAGLGRAPERPDPDDYEHFHAFADVVVAGGGVSGLAAALAAARAGARVILAEQSGRWGGRAATDGVEIDGRPAEDWVAETVAALEAEANVVLLPNAQVAAVHDHGYVLIAEDAAANGAEGLRERLWRVRAGRVVVAAGAIERPVAFAGNDRPGVMLASAVRDYLDLWGVACGEETVVVGVNDDAYRTALALHGAGLKVAAVVDPRPEPDGALPAAAREAGLRVMAGREVVAAKGRARLRGVEIAETGRGGAGSGFPHCDCVAMSGGWSPAVHPWSHCGGGLSWDAVGLMLRPDSDRPPRGHDGAGFVICAGAASGRLGAAEGLADAHAAGARAAAETGATRDPGPAPVASAPAEAPPAPLWTMPPQMPPKLAAKAFLDFQNDVKVADLRLAAREGYESVEHAKRYTTLGMATDQGKLSNIPGLAVLAEARGAPIPEVGTTTFRPPWTPVTLGLIAGDARGPLFKPVRRTPMDAWHEARGALWEPVGDWRRPWAYPRPGERRSAAVSREATAVRTTAGILDASTLGKILVQGPDAAEFLDRVYTNVMSSLPVGRCRYGLMCTEQGFLFDDGVVARLAEDAFLCHATTGGAGRVHGWLEEWLQTEWTGLRVYTADLTEQFAQVNVAGPRAREILQRPGGMDLSREALPFMAWAEGDLGGFPARVFRISFTGELSYEIAVPASRGVELWERLVEAGAEAGLTPFDTEALHVLRAETGFVMIGEETDGTATPLDLGLGWAVSKKKADFIGKRGLQRADLTRPDRPRLVGLETEDPAAVLPPGAQATEGPEGRVVGHVTSSYWSPTLGRSLALALIERGPERIGETLRFALPGGRALRARVAAPTVFDPEGERLHA